MTLPNGDDVPYLLRANEEVIHMNALEIDVSVALIASSAYSSCVCNQLYCGTGIKGPEQSTPYLALDYMYLHRVGISSLYLYILDQFRLALSNSILELSQ